MNVLPILEAGVPVLGSLLPAGEVEYSPQDRLNLRTVVYQRALEALIAFQTNRFLSLDIPAGDQACQIRALQFCQLQLGRIDEIKAVVKERLTALEGLQKSFIAMDESCDERVETIQKQQLAPLSELNRQISLERDKALAQIPKGDPRIREIHQEFAARFREVNLKKQPVLAEIEELKESCRVKQKRMIEDDTLEMTADPAVLLLARSYLATLVKVDVVSKEMGAFTYQIHSNPKKLGECGFVVPTSLLVDLVGRAKEEVCRDSIAFIQSEALKLSCARAEKIQTLVAEPRFVESKGRAELPFFHMTQVVFQRAMKEQIPILLKVRNITSHPLQEKSFACSVLFKSDGDSYKVCEVIPDDLAKRVIVIEGYSKAAFEKLQTVDYVQETLAKSGGILRLIDLNTAQHGQYTDQTLSNKGMFKAIPKVDGEEEQVLIELFTEAALKGFSLANPSTLCIDHVFCDLLGNQRAG